MRFLKLVADGTVGALQTWRWAKEGCARFTIEEKRKILLKKLELLGLKSWMEENKGKALNLLAEYHDIFTLQDQSDGSETFQGEKYFLQVFLRR